MPFFDEEHLLVGGVTALTTGVLFGLLLVYVERLPRTIAERARMEKGSEQLVGELRQALAEVRTLRGILPICAACKRIKDEEGHWKQIEVYVRNHSEADFSHSICPECARILYPEIADRRDSSG